MVQNWCENKLDYKPQSHTPTPQQMAGRVSLLLLISTFPPITPLPAQIEQTALIIFHGADFKQGMWKLPRRTLLWRVSEFWSVLSLKGQNKFNEKS